MTFKTHSEKLNIFFDFTYICKNKYFSIQNLFGSLCFILSLPIQYNNIFPSKVMMKGHWSVVEHWFDPWLTLDSWDSCLQHTGGHTYNKKTGPWHLRFGAQILTSYLDAKHTQSNKSPCTDICLIVEICTETHLAQLEFGDSLESHGGGGELHAVWPLGTV